MNKNYILALVMTFVFVGCGGSGSETTSSGSTGTTSTQTGAYALWDYLVPEGDTTNTYLKTQGNEEQSYKTRFVISNNTVTETADYAQNEKTVYTKNADAINIAFYKNNVKNGAYDLKISADIGSIVTVKNSNCILNKHYDSIKINNQSFNDVIEIVCGTQPGYYQKNVGEIAQQESLSVSGNNAISVLSN